MRYLIFGDIHGNLEAFNAVLRDAPLDTIDEFICLGDIIGYGANPDECIAKVRELGALAVAGNHDHAAIGCLDITFFRDYAREAILWTSRHLSVESRTYLAGLPFIEIADHFTCVHGSLEAPEVFNYIQSVADAEINFRMLDNDICFCSHSHVPMAFFNTVPMTYTLDEEFELDQPVKTIVNVGSVGQPRDENPLACYCIYDSGPRTIEIRRVEYDVEIAAQKILDAGLPPALALRLSLGR